jgi:hypothetical protein
VTSIFGTIHGIHGVITHEVESTKSGRKGKTARIVNKALLKDPRKDLDVVFSL